MSPSQSRQEEEYYSNLLLGANAQAEAEQVKAKFANPSSLQTAMGRKSRLVENAYAFALKQQQVMLAGGDVDSDDFRILSEEEGAQRVEELLKEEARKNRSEGHETAEDVEEWQAGQQQKDGEEVSSKDEKNSLPSILHDRPRAIRALNIWTARLAAIPYSRWTIGASTALDHWLAREVLQMDELVWQQVLEGGGTDAYAEGMEGLPGGETRRGLIDRMRDIVLVRGALFPETLRESSPREVAAGNELIGDLDEGLDEGSSSANATEKSIDDLLASLGEFDDDDDDMLGLFGDDKEEDDKDDNNEDESGAASSEKLASIMDELQVWRERNASSPYEAWDADRKDEFDVSVCIMCSRHRHLFISLSLTTV